MLAVALVGVVVYGPALLARAATSPAEPVDFLTAPVDGWRFLLTAAVEIPDARARLTHVIRMTDEAAHRTLDLVEQSGPLAERTAREATALIETVENFYAAASGPQAGPDNISRALRDAGDVSSRVTELWSSILREGAIEFAGGTDTITGVHRGHPRRRRPG